MTSEDLKVLSAAIAANNVERQLEQERVVDSLDALFGDCEKAHVDAEKVLLDYLRLRGEGPVAEAFERARERVGFFYA